MDKGTIEVAGVSRRFTLRGGQARDLRERWAALLRGEKSGAATSDLWALRDVSFRIEPGSAVGIVGHNGSGKSTMLKLLTGILKPTEGAVRTQGRLSALIEVGAGFHPDLSGRENIFLNGSILGLSRREIGRHFDEIVDFAGLERFIDTPVKRYSSGMYMRLGFAIATHVEPDILLVDEVLAVGDTYFQNKCIRRMKAYIAQGGTVIFVSHWMAQVALLCDRCLWLDHGVLRYDGPTQETVAQYMQVVADRESADFRRERPDEWAAAQEAVPDEADLLLAEARRAEAEAREADDARRADPAATYIFGVELADASGKACDTFSAGELLRVRVRYRLGATRRTVLFALEVKRDDGVYMLGASNEEWQVNLDSLPEGGVYEIVFPAPALNAGRYRLVTRLAADPHGEGFYVFPPQETGGATEFSVSAGPFAHGCVYMEPHFAPRALPSSPLETIPR